MHSNGRAPEPADLRHFDENRSNFPLDELLKYAGKHVAFSSDGMRILASGDDVEEVDRKLAALGIHFSQAVHDYIDKL
jgi:hypothetical protein